MLITLRTMLTVLVLTLPLSGCGTLVGAGAAAGTAAMEERGLDGAISDKFVQAQINSNWLKLDPQLFINLSTEVHEGRVLLTGNVAKPEHLMSAIRETWRVEGVRKVINQIHIQDRSGIINYARDAWITTKLMVKLTVDAEVKAINYNIETVNGHVFIMGIAQNRIELERVETHAYNVGKVRRVTNYAILKNDPSRFPKIKIPLSKSK